jgi:hypothetical protein
MKNVLRVLSASALCLAWACHASPAAPRAPAVQSELPSAVATENTPRFAPKEKSQTEIQEVAANKRMHPFHWTLGAPVRIGALHFVCEACAATLGEVAALGITDDRLAIVLSVPKAKTEELAAFTPQICAAVLGTPKANSVEASPTSCAVRVVSLERETATVEITADYEGQSSMQTRSQTLLAARGTLRFNNERSAIAGAHFTGTLRLQERGACEKIDRCAQCSPLKRQKLCPSNCYCPFQIYATQSFESELFEQETPQ